MNSVSINRFVQCYVYSQVVSVFSDGYFTVSQTNAQSLCLLVSGHLKLFSDDMF